MNSESRLASVDLGLSGKPNTALAKAMTAYGKTIPAFAAVASEEAPFRLVMSYPTTGMLEKIGLELEGNKTLTLKLPSKLKDLMGERVEKRFGSLAFEMGRSPRVQIGGK